jgi:hypothetical protein
MVRPQSNEYDFQAFGSVPKNYSVDDASWKSSSGAGSVPEDYNVDDGSLGSSLGAKSLPEEKKGDDMRMDVPTYSRDVYKPQSCPSGAGRQAGVDNSNSQQVDAAGTKCTNSDTNKTPPPFPFSGRNDNQLAAGVGSTSIPTSVCGGPSAPAPLRPLAQDSVPLPALSPSSASSVPQSHALALSMTPAPAPAPAPAQATVPVPVPVRVRVRRRRYPIFPRGKQNIPPHIVRHFANYLTRKKGNTKEAWKNITKADIHAKYIPLEDLWRWVSKIRPKTQKAQLKITKHHIQKLYDLPNSDHELIDYYTYLCENTPTQPHTQAQDGQRYTEWYREEANRLRRRLHD